MGKIFASRKGFATAIEKACSMSSLRGSLLLQARLGGLLCPSWPLLGFSEDSIATGAARDVLLCGAQCAILIRRNHKRSHDGRAFLLRAFSSVTSDKFTSLLHEWHIPIPSTQTKVFKIVVQSSTILLTFYLLRPELAQTATFRDDEVLWRKMRTKVVSC